MNTMIVVTIYFGYYLYQIIVIKGLLIIIEKVISSLPVNILKNWITESRCSNKKAEKNREKYIDLYQKLFTRPPCRVPAK